MVDRRREREGVRFIGLFYLAMGAIGLGLIVWRRDAFPADPLALPSENWLLALLATGGITAIIHLLSRLAQAKFASLRNSGRDIVRLFGQLTTGQVAIVALASGIGEELLFRGWLLHETGFWVSSLLFGVVHFPPNRQWLYWPFFAFAMGLILAWLYLWSGSLLFPILLHAGVNFLNLRKMLKTEEKY